MVVLPLLPVPLLIDLSRCKSQSDVNCRIHPRSIRPSLPPLNLDRLLTRDLCADFFDKFTNPVSRRALCRVLFFCSYERGDVIFHQGDVGEHFYIVMSGRIAVSMASEGSDSSGGNGNGNGNNGDGGRGAPGMGLHKVAVDIEHGAAAALLGIKKTNSARVGRLKRGDTFGEIALIANEKR